VQAWKTGAAVAAQRIAEVESRLEEVMAAKAVSDARAGQGEEAVAEAVAAKLSAAEAYARAGAAEQRAAGAAEEVGSRTQTHLHSFMHVCMYMIYHLAMYTSTFPKIMQKTCKHLSKHDTRMHHTEKSQRMCYLC